MTFATPRSRSCWPRRSAAIRPRSSSWWRSIDARCGVAEVAVFGIAHPYWVEAVTAVVVPKPGATVTEEELLALAKSELAGDKTPTYVTFADALPKNPSGKILKRELRETYARFAAE